MRRVLIPNIVNLQAFECAARHQNFSRAAEELNLTQGAISRQIAELETQTGLKLFERVRRRVILSEAGERLLPEVVHLLVESENFMIGAVAAGKMSSSLRIATLPTFGAKWLLPRLKNFIAKYPDTAISVESRSNPFSFSDESFDLAIHFGQPVWAGASAKFLCRETVMPTASRALLNEVAETSHDPIVRAPLLHLTTRPKLWSDWAKYHEIHLENAFLGLRLDQFSMITSAAVAGIGIALLPTYLIEEEIRSGQLVDLGYSPMQTANSYYIVRPENKQTHRAANDFEQWLLEAVRQ